MEKKFTRAMVCKEFDHKCSECPLHYYNNSMDLHCWEFTDDKVNSIMKEYPYIDVKVRMMFNDIDTRLTAIEKKVENNVSVEFKPERVVFGCSYNRDIGFSAEVVDQKLYDKLEAKHEADCRLISEYDLENKRLKDKCGYLERENKTFNVLLINKTETIGKLGNERDNYKLLYDTTCGNYDKLEEKYDKLLKDYKLLSESNNNHATDNIELEGKLEAKSCRIAALEEKLRNQRANLASLQEKYETVLNTKNSLEFKNATLETENNAITKTFESISENYNKLKSECYVAQENLKITKEKYEDALKKNKEREAVYYQNQILAENIKAKDREICLLRSKLSTIEDYDDYDGLD